MASSSSSVPSYLYPPLSLGSSSDSPSSSSSSSSFYSTLRSESLHYAHANGVTMHFPVYHPQFDSGAAIHAPLTLVPALLPSSIFSFITDLSPIWNRLIHSIAADAQFLQTTLKGVSESDDFTRGLLEVLSTAQKLPSSARQSISFGSHRSDYMLHLIDQQEQKTNTDSVDFGKIGVRPIQVEINTVSAGFATLCCRVSELHRYLFDRHYYLPSSSSSSSRSPAALPPALHSQLSHAILPENRALIRLSNALATAWQEHGKQLNHVLKDHSKIRSYPRAILFLVQPHEANATDQRGIEYTIWQETRIPVIRKTLAEISEQAKLIGDTEDGRIEEDKARHLIIGEYLVSVIYLRAAYTPRDFPSSKEWSALTLLETSYAIKCPTVGYHLAGTKKVQQKLYENGIVEKWLSPSEADRIRSVFTDLYGFDGDSVSEETKLLIKRVESDPDNWVLKPCREGGGNNLWGDEMLAVLRQLNPKILHAYILMKKINTPVSYTVAMRAGVLSAGPSNSEIGVFSVYMADDGGKEYLNDYGGILVRTKFLGVHEGGVAAGYAFIDSPALI